MSTTLNHNDAILGSPLLRLPGELRNQLYEEVFSLCNKPGDRVQSDASKPSWTDLLSICRQVHTEAALILFMTQTFVFPYFNFLEMAYTRLSQDQRDAIKVVKITTNLSGWCNNTSGWLSLFRWLSPRGIVCFTDLLPGVKTVKVIHEDGDDLVHIVKLLISFYLPNDMKAALEAWFKNGAEHTITVEWGGRDS
ncbi:hypothetical protein CC86DRAFT_430935 [Ophiobolus disseminans]|uniref:F-box domain-containing protein n=1 Tax=Ophiobolus disseminans TaxID=1469910 RepID=A0A6A7AET8_9PLEO|nr:hypothetical protein CC86DRAFT_430935 [Ophiobolus disseminans]